jgi:3-oxoacyl-[acyl-carrier protein] reductase
VILKLDYSGRVVLITGGTRGIGAALARDFLEAGAHVIITGTGPAPRGELNRRVAQEGKGNIRYMQADFNDEASLNRFLEDIEHLPRLDVCVNNAGINKHNLISEMETEDYDQLMRVNLRAPALICRAACRLMRQANYGRIVNIASMWSLISKARRCVYAATKTGLVGLTRTIAIDMAPYNVLANAVSPGFVSTELTASMLTPQEKADLEAHVPLQRFAQPREIAKVVLFLASDLNTYLTGQNIVVDGGFTSV